MPTLPSLCTQAQSKQHKPSHVSFLFLSLYRFRNRQQTTNIESKVHAALLSCPCAAMPSPCCPCPTTHPSALKNSALHTNNKFEQLKFFSSSNLCTDVEFVLSRILPCPFLYAATQTNQAPSHHPIPHATQAEFLIIEPLRNSPEMSEHHKMSNISNTSLRTRET